MVLNYIWIAFFVFVFVFAIIGLVMVCGTIFQEIVESTIFRKMVASHMESPMIAKTNAITKKAIQI